MAASTHTDSLGNVLAVYDDGDLGVYRHNDATSRKDIERKRKKTGDTSGGGEYMGETLHSLSFADFDYYESNGLLSNRTREAKVVSGTRIDFGSTWAEDEINSALQNMKGFFTDYVFNANGKNAAYDIKWKACKDKGSYMYGSKFNGIYVSARDAGNILAGAAARKFNVSPETAFSGFGALQQGNNNPIRGGAILAFHLITKHTNPLRLGYLHYKPYFGENPLSGRGIMHGLTY